MWKCSFRSLTHNSINVIVFRRYTVVYSAIPQVRGNCIGCKIMQMNVYTLNIYDSEIKYIKYRQNIEGNDSVRMWKCENFLSSLAPLEWHPLPDPPPARSLRSLAFVTFPLGAPPPPQCVDPRYATASKPTSSTSNSSTIHFVSISISLIGISSINHLIIISISSKSHFVYYPLCLLTSSSIIH